MTFAGIVRGTAVFFTRPENMRENNEEIHHFPSLPLYKLKFISKFAVRKNKNL